MYVGLSCVHSSLVFMHVDVCSHLLFSCTCICACISWTLVLLCVLLCVSSSEVIQCVLAPHVFCNKEHALSGIPLYKVESVCRASSTGFIMLVSPEAKVRRVMNNICLPISIYVYCSDKKCHNQRTTDHIGLKS